MKKSSKSTQAEPACSVLNSWECIFIHEKHELDMLSSIVAADFLYYYNGIILHSII